MKAFIWPRVIVVFLLLVAAAGSAAAQPAPAALQGLAPDKQQKLFHLSEGIELVPLSWIKALKSIKTGQPFLKYPERFGLIPDPTNADGLPIGVTAAPSRGAEFLGPMVGLNCAACHTGAITYQDRPMLLLGSQALYDLNAFYQELFGSLAVMLADEESRGQFLADLSQQGDVETAILTQQLLAAAAVAGQLDGRALEATAELFERRLLEVVKKVVAGAAPGMAGQARDPVAIRKLQAAVSKKVGSLIEKDALGLVALVFTPDDPKDPVNQARKDNRDPVLGLALDGLGVELSLLRARIRFVMGLTKLHEAQRPLPGPGRIDAFDGIRDLVFPEADGIAAGSPVSYPALWMVNQTYWLHWDGNTNSVIQRNVGQALGQGAPFEPYGQGNYHSKVQPENVHELEWIIRELKPPDWPEPLFGPINEGKATRGQAIYQARCANCHALAPRGGRDIYDALLAAQDWARNPKGDPPAIPKPIENLIPIVAVKTDPARAMNFATSISRRMPKYTGGIEFSTAIGIAALNYSQRSYDDNLISAADRIKYDWPPKMVRVYASGWDNWDVSV